MTLLLNLTMTYRFILFLLVPVGFCWLRWSWLRFDYSELLYMRAAYTSSCWHLY